MQLIDHAHFGMGAELAKYMYRWMIALCHIIADYQYSVYAINLVIPISC